MNTKFDMDIFYLGNIIVVTDFLLVKIVFTNTVIVKILKMGIVNLNHLVWKLGWLSEG